jgi:hypothetical protein
MVRHSVAWVQKSPWKLADMHQVLELWAKQLKPEGDGEVEPEERGRKGKKRKGSGSRNSGPQ